MASNVQMASFVKALVSDSYSKSKCRKIVCVHDALESKQHAVISVIPNDLYASPVEKFSLTGRNRN